ncbi:hypothetical protein D3874_02990 [Oleomonas cavernae]|uniref:Uncharacterized protein n=1 Tax=Oleomonas cavernae TaxID=2320859 RepID=A0A418WUE5_9PROT|nr:hypothetical protein [Oleomonas cavernae]RJF94796.1 hypothetical protein D3874_02990 [Oleomonas cavernae]
MRIAAGQVAHFKEARAPIATDDLSVGAWFGSLWLDTTTTPSTIYVCVDAAAAAAVWFDLTRIPAHLGWGMLDLVRFHQLGSAAFLPAEALSTAPILEVTNSFTLSAADNRKTFIAISGALTFALPPAASLRDPWRVIIKRGGATSLTVARAGSDTINRTAADLTIASETTVNIGASSATNYEVL